MNLYDKDLAEIIKNGTAVEINNSNYTVASNRTGSCDGCYFYENDLVCPALAVTYCTSNGGNILKIVDPK